MPLKSNLPAIRRGLRPSAARGVFRGGTMVRDLARQLAPVDRRPNRPPGPHLFETIQVEPAEPAISMQVTAGRGLRDPRAILNEYGGDSIFYPPQPYMTPAARAVNIAKEVKAELQALIKRSRTR